MKATGMQQENTTQAKGKNKDKRFSTRKFRFWAQLAASAIIVWIGVEFMLFVRYLESGGKAAFVARPPGAEGFLPISAMISLRDWYHTGSLNTIHPASVVIFVVIVLMAILFKKGFCSWVCPVGFISEMIANIGDWIVRRRLKLPRFLDWPLRSLKYLLLLFFAYAVLVQMTPATIRQFIESPYNKVADIKMLKFFVDIDAMGFWIIIGLFVFSIFLRGFWCRYLCPYGALLGLSSLLGPAKIKRDEDLCISCGECTKVCPAFIKVDEIKQVRSDECVGCVDCVDVCPVEGALELGTIGRKKKISKKVWVYAAVAFFWGALVIFKITGPWDNSVAAEEYIFHTEQMMSGGYDHPGR